MTISSTLFLILTFIFVYIIQWLRSVIKARDSVITRLLKDIEREYKELDRLREENEMLSTSRMKMSVVIAGMHNKSSREIIKEFTK